MRSRVTDGGEPRIRAQAWSTCVYVAESHPVCNRWCIGLVIKCSGNEAARRGLGRSCSFLGKDANKKGLKTKPRGLLTFTDQMADGESGR